MRYHGECFSGFADPRSQASSSHHQGPLAGTQLGAAPAEKAGAKMRTGSHFESAGRVAPALAESLGGKFGGQMSMGHNGFGSRSSKGRPAPEPRRRPGGLTEQRLAAHERALAAVPEDEAPDEGWLVGFPWKKLLSSS
ncbi:unnamed protein product [Prorocentrum cordatum]|uniref:Uncharacterized protein n=1 Tax=Prorocentrum cordatum TaxID=2364126 RepID=A0ABN9RIX6_9DINO|nr:unnamed protein product [Polarella glacialis]